VKNLTIDQASEKTLPEWEALRPESGRRMGCWLACYDIADPKRLNRIYRLMSSEAIAIQKSVFLVSMLPAEVGILTRQVLELIDPKEDQFDFVRLPRNVTAISLGKRAGGDGIMLL
jgi:CRISPR-associated protein Cas2